MRFKIILQKSSKSRFIPINYQYAISSWLYKRIQEADPEFSNFLHGTGYSLQKKQYKLFTFGRLQTKPFNLHHDRLEMQSDFAEIEFSFVADQAAENFIKGVFMNQIMPVHDAIGGVELQVIRVETLPRPWFKETMQYRLLTPVCISHQPEGQRYAQYLAPDHDRFAEILYDNLLRKYAAMQMHLAGGVVPDNQPFDFQFKLLSPYKSKLVNIKTYSEEATNLRGYLFDFELTAPVELQELGYYSGFGEKNSMGMGMGEVRSEK